MTDDLVKRLREYRIGCGIHCSDYNSNEPLDECIEAADRIEQLEAAYSQQQQVWSDAIARADRYEAALREIYEVYAGSEGIPQPISASEGYLLQLIKDMVAISSAALAGEKKDE